MKTVVPRTTAVRDVEEAIDYYRGQASLDAALGFVDALEQGYRHVSRYPASGSLRYAHELGLPGLRSWPLKRYPYVVFYIERDTWIDVWRVLHGERDIPAWMNVPQDERARRPGTPRAGERRARRGKARRP